MIQTIPEIKSKGSFPVGYGFRLRSLSPLDNPNPIPISTLMNYGVTGNTFQHYPVTVQFSNGQRLIVSGSEWILFGGGKRPNGQALVDPESLWVFGSPQFARWAVDYSDSPGDFMNETGNGADTIKSDYIAPAINSVMGTGWRHQFTLRGVKYVDSYSVPNSTAAFDLDRMLNKTQCETVTYIVENNDAGPPRTLTAGFGGVAGMTRTISLGTITSATIAIIQVGHGAVTSGAVIGIPLDPTYVFPRIGPTGAAGGQINVVIIGR